MPRPWRQNRDTFSVSAPDFEAFGLTKADCALPQVAFGTCGGLMFVNFDAEPPPLREWLGVDLIASPGVPLILVPTTSGTGSHATASSGSASTGASSHASSSAGASTGSASTSATV